MCYAAKVCSHYQSIREVDPLRLQNFGEALMIEDIPVLVLFVLTFPRSTVTSGLILRGHPLCSTLPTTSMETTYIEIECRRRNVLHTKSPNYRLFCNPFEQTPSADLPTAPRPAPPMPPKKRNFQRVPSFPAAGETRETRRDDVKLSSTTNRQWWKNNSARTRKGHAVMFARRPTKRKTPCCTQ